MAKNDDPIDRRPPDTIRPQFSDVISVANGIMTNVHMPDACSGDHCWIHRPSPTHMASWPVSWRADTRTAERMCSHSVGHPDPDDVEYNRKQGRDTSQHGCDGCCAGSELE
jgi:hypothetical protein